MWIIDKNDNKLYFSYSNNGTLKKNGDNYAYALL